MAAAYSGKTVSNCLHGVWAWRVLHSVPWQFEKSEMDAMLRAADTLLLEDEKVSAIDFITAVRQQMNLEDPLDATVFAYLTTCFYASPRLGESTVRTLQSFDANSHVTTRNLSYDQDRNNLRVTVLHLPQNEGGR
jgi:hypothetical protein